MQRYFTFFLVLVLSLLLSACMPVMDHARAMIEHGKMHHWTMDHWQMFHEGMNHEGMNHEGMNCEEMNCEEMNHEDMDCEGMNCKGMNHEGVNHGGMNHGAMANGTIPSAATPFDAQFIDSMIEHHQGAMAMAEQVLTESERPELLAMAEAIIAAQGQEIEQMQAWRAEWYPDLPPSAGMEMPMGQMRIDDDETTPFDQRFLTAMIDHHQGAVHMAEMALTQAEHEELTALSKTIIAAQTAEIEQMQEWLQTWFDVTP